MSEMTTSNMASKKYCPKCESFNLKRLHRGFFKKAVLKQPVQYMCRECKEEFSELAMADNRVREVPVFLTSN